MNPATGKRRRGRPRKVFTDTSHPFSISPSKLSTIPSTTPPGSFAIKDAENSETGNRERSDVVSDVVMGDKDTAVEGLLELSSTGSDIVRRSSRKRKKAKTLNGMLWLLFYFMKTHYGKRYPRTMIPVKKF